MEGKQIPTGAKDDPSTTLDSMADDPIRDGDRLRGLLERHNRKPSDLEEVLGRTRQMVYLYLKTPKFTPHIRDTVRRGLKKLGIDPAELMDDPTAIYDPQELRSLLEGIPNDALPNVKRMLKLQSDATKTGLIALIDEKLERRR